MLADPILTNCWGAELSAPGFTRPEFKPSQSIRPVPIIRAAGQTAWLGCNAQDGLPSAVVCIGASRLGQKAAGVTARARAVGFPGYTRFPFTWALQRFLFSRFCAR
jgi:hypothetical protein